MIKFLFLSIIGIIIIAHSAVSQTDSLSQYNKYIDVVRKIYSAAMQNDEPYKRLSYMCDVFGPRLCGSENLEKAIDWAYHLMLDDGMDNVKKEVVPVPHWVRGNESCEMIFPRNQKLPMLSLGGSIATPPGGITAELLIVRDFDELVAKADQAKGKIVLFNEPFKNYGQAVQYRVMGAVKAAQAGAVASLIRSVTPNGMKNPHTGVMYYNDTITKIPHAALTTEDADMLERLVSYGYKPIVKLFMEAQTLPDSPSANIMCELKGSEKPDEIIALGGHSDSWDVGTGAQDDASGSFATYEAVRLLKSIGIKPKRTLRSVFWVNEENGQHGGKDYAEKHASEKHVLMFEFDSGVFPPSTIGFTGPDSLFNYMKSNEGLLNVVDSITVKKGGGGVDISPMMNKGVPGMSLGTKDEGKYFWYHHSPSDTVDKINTEDFKKCIAAIAVAIYLYSEMP
jgi:carboxypeptidase Q